MITLAFDTATPHTVVGLGVGDGEVLERRHVPGPGEKPGHASQLLALVFDVLGAAGLTLADVERLGVGLGPGTFTGLRIGVATARSLAQGRDLPLAGVSTLAALAVPGRPSMGVLDARRGEAFVAVFGADGHELRPAAALTPEAIGAWAPLACGDGAVRFREHLEAAGVEVPADDSPSHAVSGAALCRLARAAEPADRDRLVPDYVRAPDAQPRSQP